MFKSREFSMFVLNKMNRTISVCLVILFLTIICFIGSVSAMTGSGTEIDPYVIYNSDDLQSMKDYLGSSTGFYFKLNNDIDCSDKTDWTPIGEYAETPTFNNHLNGNGYTIKNLTFSTSTQYAGIFGCVTSRFSIKNCIFDNINHISSKSYNGIICGYVYKVSAEVKFADVILKNSIHYAENNNVGGFIGYIESSSMVTYSNCKCENTSVIATSHTVGGFIGFIESSTILFNECEVDKCVIKSTNGMYGGGFVGDVTSSSINFNSDCMCKNSIISVGSDCVGGLIGFIYYSSTVKVSYDASAGNGCKVLNCNIHGNKKSGGFVGYVSSLSTLCEIDGGVINMCNIMSDYTGDSSYNGGIIGNSGSSSVIMIKHPIVENCVIIGKNTNVSGIVGGYSS